MSALTLIPVRQEERQAPPRRAGGRASPRRQVAPISMTFGWTKAERRRDAVALAKGWAERHLDARERSYYAVRPYAGGYLYEIQEGGSAHSYLPNVASALEEGRAMVWLRDGEKAWSFTTGGEKLVVRQQTTRDSPGFFARANLEVHRSKRRMTDVVWKGRSALVGGLALLLTGGAFYAGTLLMTGALSAPPAPPARVAADQLPYRQWPRLAGIPLTRYVETLKFAGGRWGDPVLRQIERHRNTPTPMEVFTDDPNRVNSRDPEPTRASPPPLPNIPVPSLPGGARQVPVPVTLPLGAPGQPGRPGLPAQPGARFAPPVPGFGAPGRPPGPPAAPVRASGVPQTGALVPPRGSTPDAPGVTP